MVYTNIRCSSDTIIWMKLDEEEDEKHGKW